MVFEKPLTQQIQLCKNNCKILKASVQKSVKFFLQKFCKKFPKSNTMLKSDDWKIGLNIDLFV